MKERNNCTICKSALNRPAQYEEAFYGYTIDCPICGLFFLTDLDQSTLETRLSNEEAKRAIISHYVRRCQIGERIPTISGDQLDEQLERGSLPSVFELADNLLTWIGDQVEDPGLWVPMWSQNLTGIVGARSPDSIRYCLQNLVDRGMLGRHGADDGYDQRVMLTFDGWERFEDLKRGAASGNKAFMAMKFGDPRLDAILDDHFRPAVEATGFQLFKLDDRPKAGLIDDRMRVEIKASRFLVADLTHDNEGAYWEAGYAEGLGKPVIYTCEASKFKERKTHFDTNHHLTVIWNPGSPEEAADKLRATIRFTFPEARQQDE